MIDQRLDSTIFEVFSSLDDSMILLIVLEGQFPEGKEDGTTHLF